MSEPKVHLIKPISTQPNEKLIAVIEDLLDKAKSGQVQEAAMVFVEQDYTSNCCFVQQQGSSYTSQALNSELQFLVARIQHQLMQERGGYDGD